MKKALKQLVLTYLKEVATTECSNEDLEYMADKFVTDYRRLKNARDDFKEAM